MPPALSSGDIQDGSVEQLREGRRPEDFMLLRHLSSIPHEVSHRHRLPLSEVKKERNGWLAVGRLIRAARSNRLKTDEDGIEATPILQG